MYRLRFAAPVLVLGMLTSGFLAGQDKGKKDDSKEPIIVKARLPANYNKLGLNDKQKKQIYLIRARYSVKLEELQQQIMKLKEQEKMDLENVLTEAQKARLREIQAGATGKEKTAGASKDKGAGLEKDKSIEIKKP